jgi:acetyl esterase/lipase
MKFLLPLLALVLAATSILTVVRAPDWMWAWKLTILSGEFSPWLLAVTVVLAVANVVRPAGEGRTLALALCAVAAVCFLRPIYSAQRIAEKLPADLTTAFGGKDSGADPLEMGRLYGNGPKAMTTMTTAVFAVHDGQELKLDFYPPVSPTREMHPDPGPGGGAPCIVVIHGGGWDGGDRTQLAGWNSRWAVRGYGVATIDYRLAPRWKWPAQREDTVAAIAWLKAHAAQLGIDSTRLILLGRSAGGQVAAAVGYGAHDPDIRGVVALYAPHDMPFVWSVSREDDALNSIKLMRQYLGGPPDGERRELYLSASSQALAETTSPPTLLIHGDLDTLSWVRHGERLSARLTELGVRHYFLRLPWATHGFDFNPNGPGGQLADYAIDRFLVAVTR